MWKQCTKCKRYKALWAFGWRKRGYFNTRAQCKSCYSILQKKHYLDNWSSIRRKQKLYNKNNYGKIKEISFKYRHSKHGTLVRDTWREKTNWPERRRELERSEHTLSKKREYYNNIETRREQCKDRMVKKALYKDMVLKLTIEESPRLAEDGIHLEVKCRYCGKYFIPIRRAVYMRIHSLNHHNHGEHNLYCSKECKQKCPIFNTTTGYNMLNKTYRESTPEELRQIVFKRCNYICEKCGKNKATVCHHIHPVAYEPMFQADPDSCMGVCKECHDEIHHQPGCTYPELRENSVNNCEVE